MAVRTYADAVRAALMRPAVKSAQVDDMEELDKILGLGDYAPGGKTTRTQEALEAFNALKSPEERAAIRRKSIAGQLQRYKQMQDSIAKAKGSVRKLTADDRLSLGYAQQELASKELRQRLAAAPREPVATPPLKAPNVSTTPLAVPVATLPPVTAVPPQAVAKAGPPASGEGLDELLSAIGTTAVAKSAPSSAATAPEPKAPPAATTPAPSVSGAALAAAVPDPDAGRPIDPAAVRRGALVSRLASRARSLLTPRNMAIAGGVALAGGGAALAYKLISDHLARKREEERRRQQTKQAFAPPPRAVPGIPGDVQWIGRFPSGKVIGRLPKRVMDALRRAKAPKAPKGGKAGLVASILATLATGGALAGGLAKAPKGVTAPAPTAMDKLLAVLQSPAAKTVGLGLGAAGLGAGAVYGGMKLRDKLRNGGIDIHISSLDDKGDDKDKSAS